jgi:hypothetical protein
MQDLFHQGGSKAYMPKKVPNIQRIINNDILKIVNIVFSGGGGSCPTPPAVYSLDCRLVEEQESFGLIRMQLPEKYKENFDISSEDPRHYGLPTKGLSSKCWRSPCIFQLVAFLSIWSFLIVATTYTDHDRGIYTHSWCCSNSHASCTCFL